MMAGMMIDMKVNENTDDSEVAKMIIDGTTKGVNVISRSKLFFIFILLCM